ncbi:iron uptake porin [Argonema galeatum]|uniref:iron uptake porin n=1 Tax=Argonema galeatum TaxID=2942762 RepID=UPI0020128B8F|nr:iron uptake porin [Argonema galeatum]MCL1463999.1 iron uptake porin [Argonema galeatum A003/A1]
MSKMLLKSLLFSPAILGAALVFGSSAMAAESQTTAEVSQPQAVATQSPEAQPIAAANLKLDALQHIAPAQSAAEEDAAAGSKLETPFAEAPILQQKAAASKAEAPTQARTLQEKTLADKAPTAAPASRSLSSNTVAQAAPSNSSGNLDQILQYSNEGSANRVSEGQVTSVSQLRDVQPTDWAFQALQSLVERYGCIEGYPDRTYRGNRALTRYEFAAGLNSCLNRIQELIASLPQGIGKEDLAALQRLQEEFAAELATLRGRVDALEARTTRLEAQQFSTTTKLKGEAIFALADAFGGSNIGSGVDDNNNTVFQDRVRLEFQTSFTGKDILHTRIAAGNTVPFNNFPGSTFTDGDGNGTFRSTAEGTLQYFVGGGGNNDIVLDWLAYEFPLFGSSRAYVAAFGGLHADYADVSNPYFYDGDGGNGAISAFAQQNPIYRIGGGAGGGISFSVGRGGSFFKPSSITVGYLAGGSGINRPGNSPTGANNPTDTNGLLDGNYSALAQLNFSVSNSLGFALTYVHSYHNTGSDIFDGGGGAGGRLVGTSLGNLPSTLLGTSQNGTSTPIAANSYGAQAAFRLSKNFSISGWASMTDATLIRRGTAQMWTYGLGVALPNIGREGNVLGLFAGAEPYLTGIEVAGPDPRFRRDIPWHLEGFYKFQLTDNISVTPGVIWLMAPDQNKNNDDIFIGTLRTTFTF